MTLHEVLLNTNTEFSSRGIVPYDINNGYCSEWADSVFASLDTTTSIVEVWETPFGIADTSHTFIRIDGLFYDAECLTGVSDHMDLPIFTKLIPIRQPVWLLDHNGKYFDDNRRDMSQEMVNEYYQSSNIIDTN